MLSKVKITIANNFLYLVEIGNKVLLSRPRNAMFVLRKDDVRLHQPLQTLNLATPLVIA